MIVYSEMEKSDKGGGQTVHEKTEALHLGLAIESLSLLPVKSKLLGMFLEDHLKKAKLL
jgi:hypothetical protein